MIGKMMSEAAHSVVGMFSAKPLTMENNALTSDFGSLLRIPGQQPQSGSRENGTEDSKFDLINIAGIEPAPAENWDGTIAVPFLSQSFGNVIRDQDPISQKGGKDPAVFAQSGNLTSDLVSDVELTESGTSEQSIETARGTESNILSPGSSIAPAHGSSINGKPSAGTENMATNRLFGETLPSEKNGTGAEGSKLHNDRINKSEGAEERLSSQEFKVSNEISTRGEKGLGKLNALQQNSRAEATGELSSLRNTSTALGLEKTAAMPSDHAGRVVLGVQTRELGAVNDRGRAQTDPRLGPGQIDSRPAPGGSSPLPTVNVQTKHFASTDAFEATSSELLAKAKNFEIFSEQQALANGLAQAPVREPVQKLASFDMSMPQIAQRLAAEIVDISVNGEMKKFEINPRNLGRMEIIFTTRGSAEIIEIQTENKAAKDVIAQHGPLLQEILKSQGRDDLTLRIDVKENMFSSQRNDGANLSQQENRDAREEHARSSQPRSSESFGSTVEDEPASDNNRYA